MTLAKRQIDVEFILNEGTFENTEFNTVMVKGLRVQANIVNTDGPAMGNAQLRIFGLPPSLLNQISGLNQAAQAVRNNKIIVCAGDEVSGMPIVFQGTISLAQVDMANAPDSSLTVCAFAGYFEKMKTAPATSYPGSADAAVIMSDFAVRMGFGFEANDVSVMLSTPYFSGTLLDQAESCAQAANIAWTIENNTLAIWDRARGRGGAIPLISPDTGLVGYPGYSSGQFQGLAVTTIFNPLLRVGKPVKIESSLRVANGTWTVFDIAHALESETPGGKWFSQFNASPFGGQ